MATLEFYGASDDLIEIDGDLPGADEYGLEVTCECESLEVSQAFVVGEALKVYAIYDGCWHFSIGQVAEDVPIPLWPVRYRTHERGYSVVLAIDVPDGTSVREELGYST